MTKHRFDLDIDPGPLDSSYSPSAEMAALVRRIAELDELTFRFWCAKTLAVNMSSVIPLRDAEDVVIHVVSIAIDEGRPTDGAYNLHLDEEGEIVAVQHDEDVNAPDDFDRLIFQTVALPDGLTRAIALLQLAQTTAFDHDEEALAIALRLFNGWTTEVALTRAANREPAANP